MTYQTLISCPLITDSMSEFADRLAANGIEYDVVDVDQHLTEEELIRTLDEYDGILAGDDELSARVIERAPRLKVISKWGIGLDNVDRDAAAEFGVSVYNTPGDFATEVADVVLGYAVMLTRKLHEIDTAVRSGEWASPRGISLQGKTFGVIGVGNIGGTVARRAHSFDMNVVGNDVEPIAQELKRETDITAVDKNELLEESAIVSLNCALTDATHGLIGREELDCLGSESYLINTARGELIDESALVEALRSGRIAGAALDVFQREPLPGDHPLTELDNVILGSHNAQNTTEAVARVNERAIDNLIDGLANGSD